MVTNKHITNLWLATNQREMSTISFIVAQTSFTQQNTGCFNTVQGVLGLYGDKAPKIPAHGINH